MKYALFIFLLIIIGCNTGKTSVGGKVDPNCLDLARTEMRSCPDEVRPVCGCDGKTYTNECAAWNAKLKTWTKGPCPPEDCIDESKINLDLICAAVYQPVCGCDGKIYSNPCEAERKGVSSWVDGDCNR